MNNLDKQYKELLQDIMENGVVKGDRTGTGTISVFGRQIRHKMSDGFPLITTKKMAWKQIVTELQWFLRGETNIQSLVKAGNNIWVGDAYKRYKTYCENQGIKDYDDRTTFIEGIKENDQYAEKWGELGPVYGKQWRKWPQIKFDKHQTWVESIDQINNLIDTLKNNPDSRRIMVNAWNVGEIDKMVLPPCHYGFQVWTRELSLNERLSNYCQSIGKDKNPGFELGRSDDYYETWLEDHNVPKREITLMWNQRSVDTFLGLPFNIASYGLLLLMLADELNMVPGDLIGNLGDTHLYSNHIDQAREQLSREGFELPTVSLMGGILSNTLGDVALINYVSHPTIKAPLSN